MLMSRREFVKSAALTAAIGGAMHKPASLPAQPATAPGSGRRPTVVASANGLRACERAMELLQTGADPVDAVVAGVNLVEDDPNDHSVGYGGLPNEDGIVELDASVMHGPTHKAGAVAALRNIRNPSSVARLVMQRTDHVLLVGEGALRFARAHGFKEEDLLTDEARRLWLEWKENLSSHDYWLPPEMSTQSGLFRDHKTSFTWGTITCLAVTAAGDLGGCTSTSGLSYKIAGRVGDSPIIGAGLYVDNEVGACGSTGRGEANMLNCTCFLVVELMRAGATPAEACLEALGRVARRTEARLRDAQGYPNFGLILYALRKDGVFGGASLRGTATMAVHDGTQARLVDLPGIFPALPRPHR
jgi:N4-(beta-N-acetylglucosaminyl)-L-asparaginase